jgi:peptidyl-prolyl cis-trans isomerase SurA
VGLVGESGSGKTTVGRAIVKLVKPTDGQILWEGKDTVPMDEAEFRPLRKKIQMIANRLDSGDDFATLAMKYSEDPETAGNGGDLGTVPESGLKGTDPATRETVIRLKPGQYSPIVGVVNPATKQAVGFRIVKLVAKEPAGQRDLSDPRVQQAIRSQLHDRREQLLKAAYYEVLRDSAKVENYYAKKVLDNNGMEK